MTFEPLNRFFITKSNSRSVAMSKCVLSIELENPNLAVRGGDKVRGHLNVSADADVRCRSVTIYAGWRTRGKGNVAQELGPKVVLFSGDLAAGQSQRFAFEVETVRWPATYVGFQFNVEHFVEATADIPWAFDPQVSVPLFVLPGATKPEDFPKPGSLGVMPQIAIGIVFSVMAGVTMLMMLGPNPLLMAVVPVLIMTVITLLMLTFKWLPKLYVGQVVFELKPDTVSPGQSLEGYFSIKPNRSISPEYIRLQLTATEVCVSGSGSNAKTHRHELFDRKIVLADHPVLPGDKTQRYEIRTTLPPVAAYSLKLPSNELQWTAELRVGIPGLVDWKDRRVLSVVPSLDPAVGSSLKRGLDAATYGDSSSAALVEENFLEGPYVGVASDLEPDAQITFAETVGHIWSVRDQADQAELLIDAVAGIPMEISARIERRQLSGGIADPQMNEEEYLVLATCDAPPLPLSLYVPHALGDDFEQDIGQIWHGQGEIVGWDRREGRLQVRVYF